MNATGKIFVKTCLKAIRNTFFVPICGISQYVIFLSNRRGKFKLLGLQGDPPPSLVPSLCGASWSLHEENPLKVIGLLIVMIFFQSQKSTVCKVKDEKEETVFYFLMVFNLLKIIDPFESKKHLRT